MRAYQTVALAKNAKLLKDVKSGLIFFCQESNVVSPDGTPVVVKVNTDEMDLSTDDPFQNVKFLP